MPCSAKNTPRLRITVIVAFLALLGVGPGYAQLPEFEATYRVRYGLLSGELTLALERHGAEYTYRTSLRPRGFASWLRSGEIQEASTLLLVEGRIRPKNYVSTDTISRPERRTRYVFDEPPGRVTGVYKSRAIDLPMQPNGQNRISAQVAVMLALQSDAGFDTLAVFDRGRWRDFRFEVLPGQTANTPAGRFDTVEVRYASRDNDKRWSLHCAETLNFLPVMIVFSEDGAVKSRAMLTDYRMGAGSLPD